MIDLTPLDVRSKRGDFRKLLRGYDPEEVDVFLEMVADRLEELVRENIQLRDRSESLQEQVTAWSGRERAVQEALVTAQELRTEMKILSQQQADLVLGEAQADSRRMLAEAEAEIRAKYRAVERRLTEAKDRLEELDRRRIRFLKSYRQLLEREMDVVEIEQARPPLEEHAMELDLGGGSSEAESEDGPGGVYPPHNASVDDLADEFRMGGSSLFDQ